MAAKVLRLRGTPAFREKLRQRRVRMLLARRVPPPKQTRGIVLRYRAAVRKLMARFRSLAMDELRPAIERHAAKTDAAEREVAGLRVQLHRIVERGIDGPATAAFDAIDGATEGDVVSQFAVLEVDVLGSVPGIARRLPAFVRRNVDLIESVAAEQLGEVRTLVTEAVTTGLRVEELARAVLERFDVAQSRAELIARDQVLKLHGDVTKERQTGLGVRRYEWSTSNDERVRERHAELEGQTFSWDEPPEVSDDGRREHPGGDYQCRCVAIPVFDEGVLAEALGREEESEEGEE